LMRLFLFLVLFLLSWPVMKSQWVSKMIFLKLVGPLSLSFVYRVRVFYSTEVMWGILQQSVLLWID
jgi:hypothetical protein